MHSQQLTWNPQSGWTPFKAAPEKVSLVFYFGTRQMLACGKRFSELREMFPAAHILGCSTGGQISNSDISDDEIVAAAISFDATRLQLVRQDISDAQQSRDCGETIGRALQREDLAGIFVLSDGLNVNGSELVSGLVAAIGPNIPLTGGLAGDGADFAETLVGGDCAPRPRTIVGIGFYGSAICIGHGSAGGWDLFGPRRHVTKSTGNVLFELDGPEKLHGRRDPRRAFHPDRERTAGGWRLGGDA
jgi:hypothetical protein